MSYRSPTAELADRQYKKARAGEPGGLFPTTSQAGAVGPVAGLEDATDRIKKIPAPGPCEAEEILMREDLSSQLAFGLSGNKA